MTTIQEIEAALKGYLEACYGNPHKLGTPQLKEVRQAFLSGIHWRNCTAVAQDQCEAALRQLPGIHRERN